MQLCLIALVLLSITAELAYAEPVHLCTGDRGEPLFSDKPCTSEAGLTESEVAAAAVENDRLLERLRQQVVRVKREIMDLEREREHSTASMDDEVRVAFEADYSARAARLQEQLRQLEARESEQAARNLDYVLANRHN